ncbi:hypothetical protein [Nitrosopumilus zosterae]|nr:hypothetical protein [Nitrosopumilus zosterae]BDQ30590.1 hypothetical protein NZOSNM25_000696 [Nitrosopumilus zosterae]
MKKSKFVGITIPKELYDKIEKKRGDLPRSYIYKKLVETGYEQGELKW